MGEISDERREVAKKIRAYVDAYGDGIEDAEMVLLGTVWGRDNRGDVVRPTSEAELLSMLADLIDPTCHNQHPRASDGCFCCSECLFLYEPTDWSACWNSFLHCPRCGARVVDGYAN